MVQCCESEMPVCANESVCKLWSPATSPSGTLRSKSCSRANGSVSPPSPGSPLSSSPPSRLFRSQSSTLLLLDRSHLTRPPTPLAAEPPQVGLLATLIGWYPTFILRFTRNLIATLIYLAWSQFLLIGPTLWLSAWLWALSKAVQVPLTVIKWLLTILHTPASERSRKKRTVLISGGSTIQALHLARNFYSAGARVVVCEVEGLFGLARFSTAVHRFYTVPRPTGDKVDAYIRALKNIVDMEKASYYIPVSVTTTAYYDALAKPHLELMGCTCFCPGLKEVCILDDRQELLRRCQAEGLSTPLHYQITSKQDVLQLYDDGTLTRGRHVMISVGPQGCKERTKVVMPHSKRIFVVGHPPISEHRPWLIVKDYHGERFMTCTTVKESLVVANVTCRVEASGGRLVPVDHNEINIWLNRFFSKLRFLRPVTGHMSFRFVVSSLSGSIVPLGCRVGVSLPYICHTSVHTRIVWRPCRHFSPQASGPLVNDSGRYWMHEAVIDTLKNPGVVALGKLIGTVLDKREALFVYWDPLPYCAYYHLQLPFERVLRFVQGHNNIYNDNIDSLQTAIAY